MTTSRSSATIVPAPDGGPAASLPASATAPAVALPPGVDEVPLLRTAIEAAHAADRAVAALLEALLELDEHQLAEAITGIPLEQWLAIAGRRTRGDRRMLLTTCDVLRRLPSLRRAFLDAGQVSWAQVRTVALQVERLPGRLDDAIDDALARAVASCAADDPDVLSSVVNQALRSLDPAPAGASDRPGPAPTEEFLAIQPRLDGAGGQLFGELGAVGLATVDAALTPAPHEARDGRGHRGAAARERARRLVRLCDGALDGGTHPEAGGSPSGSRPQLLVRVDLATLLDGDALPGSMLTRLTGGRLWADAATVRHLVEHRGADLRTVVLDDCGGVVGVGQRTRVPPGWLRDAVLALHDTCTAPGCLRPARSADLDHARPWEPPRPGAPDGRTDIDQLGPLCRTHNRTKESAGWTVHQTADGSRRWYHAGTGLTTTTRPATWRPPRAEHLGREARGVWRVGGPPERAGPRRARPEPGPQPGTDDRSRPGGQPSRVQRSDDGRLPYPGP